MTKQSGFSMIELIIYITIVGILMITVGPGLWDFVVRAKERKTDQTLLTLKMQIQQYNVEIGHYPPTLEALLRKPANEPGWRHRFLDPDTVSEQDGKIVDPWGQPYVYRPTKTGTHQFDLYSIGDPQEPVKLDVWDVKK